MATATQSKSVKLSPQHGVEAVPAPNVASNAALSHSTAKAVVVHSGARDSYQVARALYEAGRLDSLITDLY